MAINPVQILEDIKRVGTTNARVTPGPNSKCSIEIFENNTWRTIATGLSQKLATKLIIESKNRVILG